MQLRRIANIENFPKILTIKLEGLSSLAMDAAVFLKFYIS
jgi:hypothetical protein